MLRRSQPFAEARATASPRTDGVTRRRSVSETKNVNVPVSWQTGVPSARASSTLRRIVSSTIRADDPFASRRNALRSACSASSGRELEVSWIKRASRSTRVQADFPYLSMARSSPYSSLRNGIAKDTFSGLLVLAGSFA